MYFYSTFLFSDTATQPVLTHHFVICKIIHRRQDFLHHPQHTISLCADRQEHNCPPRLQTKHRLKKQEEFWGTCFKFQFLSNETALCVHETNKLSPSLGSLLFVHRECCWKFCARSMQEQSKDWTCSDRAAFLHWHPTERLSSVRSSKFSTTALFEYSKALF